MSWTKISAAQIANIYSEVPHVLRALAAECDELKTKLAAAEQQLAEFKFRDRLEKIARKMEERHIDLGTSFEDKIERIKQAVAAGRSLDAIEEAVDMVAPRAELGKLGSVDKGPPDEVLVSYLLGGLDG